MKNVGECTRTVPKLDESGEQISRTSKPQSITVYYDEIAVNYSLFAFGECMVKIIDLASGSVSDVWTYIPEKEQARTIQRLSEIKHYWKVEELTEYVNKEKI